jgi:glycosyltransferase involved in cell wall biosynthesis
MPLNIPPIAIESALPWENSVTLECTNEDLPTLSVVIPIFNSGRFVEKTIRSLLCNDLNGVELIVMDGGSSDNTMDVIGHYKDFFHVVRSEKDKGQSDAINKGFEIAGGEILYWLNGDDIILPNVLNKIRRHYKSNKLCEVLVGNAYMTEIDFKPISYFKFTKDKLKFEHLLNYAKNHLIQPSVFFTRKAWDRVGPLDINDHYAMDADLFIGMAKNYNFDSIDQDIAYSVYHEDCKTRGKRAESITALALVQAKYGGFTELKDTLQLLVNLYNEQINAKIEPSKDLKIKTLEAKVKALKEIAVIQKELCIKADLVTHS